MAFADLPVQEEREDHDLTTAIPVRFQENAQIASVRSVSVLRRIGMTTREGSASGSRGCLPGDRKGMTRSKRANGGGRRRGYT